MSRSRSTAAAAARDAAPARAARVDAVTLLYGAGILFGAMLLFLVQPMAAKMLLPSLGGSPAVWNTAMVFFQVALLAGYAYAHLLARRLAWRTQVAIHAVVLLVPLAFLPMHIGQAPPADGASPAAWVLVALTLSIGAPFVVVSTTGPLLQRWYAASGSARSEDPYFLYAASNLGSLGSLLAYPLLLEPRLAVATGGLASQTGLWAIGYGVYVVLVVACGVVLWKARGGEAPASPVPVAGETPREGLVTRATWVGLAFIPSSLMLGTTLTLSTDVAAVPLLWVLPLAVYLATFVVAFSSWGPAAAQASRWALPPLVLVLVWTMWTTARPDPTVGVPLFLGVLAAAGLAVHGRLAAMRPAVERLTGYYLLISVGGALGGIFCALVAPLVFTSVIEYPIALAAACLALPGVAARGRDVERRARVIDVAAPVVLAVALAFAILPFLKEISGDTVPHMRNVALFAILAAAVFVLRPVRFGLAVLVLVFIGQTWRTSVGDIVYSARTFFGVMRITKVNGINFEVKSGPEAGLKANIPFHALYHGTTLHGAQLMHPQLRYRATTYFHVKGPLGHVFRTYRRQPILDDVVVVGLGVGSIGAYAERGQRFRFYDIDPEVISIARNPEWFTYLRDAEARGATIETAAGDGRKLLEQLPDGQIGLLIMDAFSSDAPPLHLMTREAMDVYFRKLRPDGILAVNVSVEHFDFLPVLAEIAAATGRTGLSWFDFAPPSEQDQVDGKSNSRWVVLANKPAILTPLMLGGGGWQPLEGSRQPARAHELLWTDDFASPLSVLRRG